MTDIRIITHNPLHHIKGLADSADTIYMVTAFLMKSGVKEILPVLQQAALPKADIKILTENNYIAITQPDALIRNCSTPISFSAKSYWPRNIFI